MGMLADISGQIANMHVMIHSIFTKETKDTHIIIYVTVTVNSASHLHSLSEKLKKVKGVVSVERTGL